MLNLLRFVLSNMLQLYLIGFHALFEQQDVVLCVVGLAVQFLNPALQLLA